MYKATLCDAIWTQTRLDDAGYDVDTKCQKCGLAEDTIHHRVWQCTHPPIAAIRKSVAKPELIQEALTAGPKSMWFNRGLPLSCADFAVGPSLVPQAYYRRDGALVTDAFGESDPTSCRL